MAYKIGQTIKAKYAGFCKITGKPIKEGDLIVYQNVGWCLSPKNVDVEAEPMKPKTVDDFWWRTDLAKIIGKELTQDFELAQPTTLVAWDNDANKLVHLICAKNKYTARNFVFSGMTDPIRAYVVVKYSNDPIVRTTNVGGTQYVNMEAIDDDCWAMESIVGDWDEYTAKRYRYFAELKVEELVAGGMEREFAAEGVYNGIYD